MKKYYDIDNHHLDAHTIKIYKLYFLVTQRSHLICDILIKRILLALTNVSLYLVRLLVCRWIKIIGDFHCKKFSGAYYNMLPTATSSMPSFS